jgi:hypothetical protein
MGTVRMRVRVYRSTAPACGPRMYWGLPPPVLILLMTVILLTTVTLVL